MREYPNIKQDKISIIKNLFNQLYNGKYTQFTICEIV